jgi:hypothetical protein
MKPKKLQVTVSGDINSIIEALAIANNITVASVLRRLINNSIGSALRRLADTYDEEMGVKL